MKLILQRRKRRIKNWITIGHNFVCIYYNYSPPMVDFIAEHDSLRAMVRISLLPVVCVNWIVLRIGSLSTVALMLIFISLGLPFLQFCKKWDICTGNRNA